MVTKLDTKESCGEDPGGNRVADWMVKQQRRLSRDQLFPFQRRWGACRQSTEETGLPGWSGAVLRWDQTLRLDLQGDLSTWTGHWRRPLEQVILNKHVLCAELLHIYTTYIPISTS